MALLCLSLTERTLRENLETAGTWERTADLYELRADFLDPGEIQALASFPGRLRKPVILTVRRQREGGMFSGGDSDRASIMLRGMDGAGFSFLDLEEDFHFPEVERKALSSGTKIIRSIHEFSGVPAGLFRRMLDMEGSRNEILKAAVMPSSTEDQLALLETAEKLNAAGRREKILIGMGPWGVPSRILAEQFGSILTFCSLPGKEAAPGHIAPDVLADLYRVKSISGKTKIFGIIGNPVMHSISPLIHNKGFRFYGTDAVYVPFQTDDPGAFKILAEKLGVAGFSVTVPHKETVLPFLDTQEESVRAIGSCNTVIAEGGSWNGYNTDASGFIEPVRPLFTGTRDVPVQATVIGAGGAARAVVWALRSKGCRVCVLNRTPEKARGLSAEFGTEWGGFDERGRQLASRYNDLWVQTTSAGMHPDVDSEPWPGLEFSGRETVYDIVYTPKYTRWLRRAEAAGCRIVTGDRMLQAQAVLQFRLFIGKEYPQPLLEGNGVI